MEEPYTLDIPEGKKHIVLTIFITQDEKESLLDFGLTDAEGRGFIDYKGAKKVGGENFYLGKELGTFTRAEIWGIMEEKGYELKFVNETNTGSDVITSLYFRLKD